MTDDKELISKIQALKQIKPRENWVLFVRSQIFRDNIIENKITNKLTYKEVLLDIFNSVFQRKFTYAFAALLFVIAGMVGFMNYSFPDNTSKDVKVAQQSQENLVAIKSNVEDFKAKSRNLSQMAKLNSQDISLAIKEVKDAAKELTDAIKKDPQLAKEIALEINNNKTYLDIQGGGDLKETSDALYKEIDSQMIEDLQETTLTESQQEALNIARDLYDQEKYSRALESILLLDMAIHPIK